MATRVTCVLPPLFVFLALSFAAPASAQRVAISVAAPDGTASTVVRDLQSGQARRISDDAADMAFFTSDGTVLVWHPSGALEWRATVVETGFQLTLPPNFGLPGVVHPRELAVYGHLVGTRLTLGRLDAGGLHVLDPCGPDRLIGPFDILADGRRLVAVCGATPQRPTSAVVQIDASTGAVFSTVEVSSTTGPPIGIAVTGTDYVVATWEAGPIELVRRRVSDNQVQATARVPGGAAMASRSNLLAPNARRRDAPAMVLCVEAPTLPSGYDCRVEVLDTASLSVASTLQTSGPVFPVATFSADGTQALVSGVTAARLADMSTGQTIASASAPLNGLIVAAWGAEPQAPLLAPPVVAGNAVTLSWTLPVGSAAVTGYRLEAGSQPGLADILTTALGPAPSLAAAGVPPGRYYVRVRGVNANGASVPSNEVVVTVP